MPIRYVDASSPVFPAAVRTRSVTEPSDAGVRATDALPKTSAALPKLSLNIGNTVTEIIPPVTEKKRGRPPKPDALTAAEKQRRYRERLKAARVCSA